MTDKTLGQVGYVAWFAGLVSEATEAQGEASWDCISKRDPERRAWEAAAEAVIDAGLDHMSDTVEADRLTSQERAVIEAAKAYADVRWAEPYKDNADQADRENLSRFALLDAVEALLAAGEE